MKTSFVEYHQFDPQKIGSVRDSFITNKGYQSFVPIYDYTSWSKYPLMIRTEFMDITGDPFKFVTSDTKKFISIDPNDNSVSHMYQPLEKMAKFTTKLMNTKYGSNKLKELGPILSNYTNGYYGESSLNYTNSLNTELKMKNIKFLFPEKDNKITSTIYNYNKSRKYLPVEEFNSCTLVDVARFVTKGKQVRFILEPKIWSINSGVTNNGPINYGTQLYIKYMEVKYKDQYIKSKIDENQIEIYDRIKSVEI